MLASKQPNAPRTAKSKSALFGQKKRHTNKEFIISSTKRRTLYVSKSYKGKEHGYELLKVEFPPDLAWFKGLTLRLDLGFQELENLYEGYKV